MDKKMKVRIGIGAAIAVAAVLLMLSGKKKGQQGPMGMGQEAAATIVKAQKPSVGDISLTTGLTGTVEPSDVVYVYAKASGDVTSVLVKAGDMVEQGQVLCEIDTEQVETARNSMDSASVSLSEAQSNLSRMQILYASGDLSDQEYEQYSNKVKSARLQYESAKLAYDRQVEYSTVTAPISGKIENCDIEVHDRVSQSAQLCVIAGEGEKRVSFYVTERMMGNIAVGDRLDIQKDGTGYEAYISEISSMVDSDTGLFKVKAELKHADGIATGSTVKLNLVTEHTENAMMIPVDAVYYSGVWLELNSTKRTRHSRIKRMLFQSHQILKCFLLCRKTVFVQIFQQISFFYNSIVIQNLYRHRKKRCRGNFNHISRFKCSPSTTSKLSKQILILTWR